MTKIKTLGISLAVVTAISFSGCGSSDSTTPPVEDTTTTSLSGNLGTSYAMYKSPWYDNILTKAYAAGFGQVSKAIAIPLLNGEIDIGEAKEVTINDNGTFSVALKKQFTWEEDGENITADASWIILMEKTDSSINFLSIPNANGSESLINLPIGKSTSDIAFGDIENSADEANTNLKLDGLSEKVSYNINDLTSLSTTDDVAKAAVNSYKNNYNKSKSEQINVKLTVIAEGNFTKIATEYSKASDYKGYAINIGGGSETILKQNFTTICNNSKQMSLELPSGEDVTFVGDSTYTTLTSNGGTLNGTSCSSNGIFQEQSNDDGGISLNFGGGSAIVNSVTVPSGNWILKFDGNTLGTYNLAYSLPVANGKMKLPIPAIKLDLDSSDNNKTKGFYIKWYVDDIEVSNTIISTIIPKASLYTQGNSGLAIDCSDAMLDTNSTLKSYINISECKENGTTPDSRYYNPTGGQKALESVYVRYETPGNEVRFSYND
jgi:hypothetical protein